MTDTIARDPDDWEDDQTAPAAADEGDDEQSYAGLADSIDSANLAGLSLPPLGTRDRLIRFAYGLGIPARMLTAPLGQSTRPRLLATVENTLPGSRIAGTALRAGHVLVHDARLPLGGIDYGNPQGLAPPFARMLHGFHWLADLEASAPREQGAPLAEALFVRWMGAHAKAPSRPTKSGGWTVANAGWRLLNWLVHAPLILSGTDRAARNRAFAAIEQHARWLERNARRAPDKLAEATAWSALVAAGLLLSDGKPRRLHAERGLVRALGELVGSDGAMPSRSAIAQIEAITLLVKLRACYRACRLKPPAALDAMIALLLPPLLVTTHADGSLGSWHGGWAVSAEDMTSLVTATGLRRRPPREAAAWGYQRIVAGKSVLVVDIEPPPLPRIARHGCASTLAFEFSRGSHRLVVNCGGGEAAGGLVPLELERGLRATAAHSTLTLDDANSTAILSGARIGKGVATVSADCAPFDTEPLGLSKRGGTRIEASHDGYVRRYGLVHQRQLTLSEDGTELRGEDRLQPAKRKGKRRKVGFAVRFHLGRDVQCFPVVGARGAHLVLPDGSTWLFDAAEGEVSVDDSIWVDGAGRPVAIRQLVLHDAVGRTGGSFAWSFSLTG